MTCVTSSGPVRILMASTVGSTLSRFIVPLATHFRVKGWRVDAVANGVSTYEDCRTAFDHVVEITWSRHPLDAGNLRGAPALIRKLVAREDYDIVHVHTPVAAFVTRYALRNLRREGTVKVIYTAHGFHFYRGGPRARNLAFLALEKLAGRWTDYLVVINREDEQAAKAHRLVPDDRVCYMPGIGVDTSTYRRANVSDTEVARVRREIGVSDSDTVFLMIAEFIKRKRHADVLRALAQMRMPNTYVVFAGDGPLLQESKKLANGLGIASRVRFLGVRDDIPSLLAASNALILPSNQEGLPRSVMEAMCMGVPVIGSRIRGTRDLIELGGGLLVRVGDVDGLAGAMTWLAEHPEEARAMGERGRSQISAYDLDRIIEQHEILYTKALSRS